MTRRQDDREDCLPTVADALATAEAWNERAAVLSTMAFELRTVFGPLHGCGPAPYLIRRIGGGASPASLAMIEDVRAELFVAAKRAREEARKILISATDARADGRARGLVGSDVAPSVDRGSIKIPSGGDEVVANAECPRAHQKLGDGPKVVDETEEQEPPAGHERVPGGEEPPPMTGNSETTNVRSLRPKQQSTTSKTRRSSR